MPLHESDAGYLWDMLDAARTVQDFVTGRNLNEYLNDRMLRSAVERQVEVIGEAARRVSAEFQAAHDNIPWRSIIVQRHVLAHEYGDIKHELVWKVATVHIPELIELLLPLVPEPPSA